MALSREFLSPLYLRFGLKVGLACALAYVVSNLIGSDYAIWAVISTILAMQVNVADSLRTGWQSFVDTLLGAVVGVVLLVLVPKTHIAMGVAVVTMATLYAFLTRFSNRSTPVSVATMVVLLVGAMYAEQGYREAIWFGLLRVAEILIGVGSAFLVSVFVWPVRLADTLRTDLELQFDECARLLRILLQAFLSRQQVPFSLLEHLEGRIWENHERLSKARKHESILYHYEHESLHALVKALDRTTESLRSMMEALNDYDEECQDPLMGAELEALGQALGQALRYLGGVAPETAVPTLVHALTSGVGNAELRLAAMRHSGQTQHFNLHTTLQLFAFYQSMRLLAESLLMTLEALEGAQPVWKK